MVKVAYVLSGQPRHVREALPTLRENVLDRNDCDLFVHTWYDPSAGTFTSSQAGQDNRVGSLQPDTLALINELNPVAMTYERQIDFKKYVEGFAANECARPDQLASMYYSICAAGKLMLASGRKYDIVVRTRLDMVYLAPFIIPSEIEENVIYAPAKWQDCRKDGSSNDCLSFSTYDNMLPVFDIFEKFPALSRSLTDNPFAEHYYGYNIIQSGRVVKSYPMDVELAQRIIWERK